MDDTLRDVVGAARYLKLPVPFFRHQLKHGTGPRYVSPSKRSKFFTTEALDAWRDTWTPCDGSVAGPQRHIAQRSSPQPSDPDGDMLDPR